MTKQYKRQFQFIGAVIKIKKYCSKLSENLDCYSVDNQVILNVVTTLK